MLPTSMGNQGQHYRPRFDVSFGNFQRLRSPTRSTSQTRSSANTDDGVFGRDKVGHPDRSETSRSTDVEEFAASLAGMG